MEKSILYHHVGILYEPGRNGIRSVARELGITVPVIHASYGCRDGANCTGIQCKIRETRGHSKRVQKKTKGKGAGQGSANAKPGIPAEKTSLSLQS